MKRIMIASLGLVVALAVSGCGSTEPPPDVDGTVSAAVAATLALMPTQPLATVAAPPPLPTYTPYPTYTPFPVAEEVGSSLEAATTVEPTPEPPTEPPASPSPPPPASPSPSPAPVSPPVAPSQIISTTVRAKDGAVMVFVPAGEFLMGATDAELGIVGAGGPPKLAGGDEQPQHPVNLAAFWIDQTEITNAQFSNFTNLSGYKTTAELEGYGTSAGEQLEGATFFHPRGITTGIDNIQDHPVVQVSFQDAKTYCEWAGGRLPVEAEWEKAAKGVANDRVFPWGNAFQLPEFDVAAVTNFCSSSCPLDSKDPEADDGYPYTAPVGSFPAGVSPYGALDMAGNVWEWVDSAYLGYPGHTYEQAADFNDYFIVVRGGSWDNAAQHVRSTFRQNNEPRLRSDGTGFRCAISAADYEPADVIEPTATDEPESEPTSQADTAE